MALTKISTGGVKDDAASQAKIADEAVDEARLQISNAGTNGQFLQKQSGNSGGLTWSDVPAQYTHPNHSGEVTSTGDGATVIADNIVDEDNLKISNAGTNGQYLQKQSGNTGGLTWATLTVPPAGNTVDLVADGAIAAGKPVFITSAGKAKQIAEELTARAVSAGPLSVGSVNLSTTSVVRNLCGTYDPNADKWVTFWASPDDNGVGMITVWRFTGSNDTCTEFTASLAGTGQNLENSYYRRGAIAFDASTNNIIGIFSKTASSHAGQCWSGTTTSGSTNQVTVGFMREFESGDTRYMDIVYNPDAQKSLICYTDDADNWYGKAIVVTSSGTGSSADISFGSTVTFNSGSTTWKQVVYDTQNDKFIVFYIGSSNYIYARVGTISGTSTSWSSETTIKSVGCANVRAVYTTGGVTYIQYTYSSKTRCIAVSYNGSSFTVGTEVELENYVDEYHECNYDATNGIVVSGVRASYSGTLDYTLLSISGTTVTKGGTSSLAYNRHRARILGGYKDGKMPLLFSTEANNGLFGQMFRTATVASTLTDANHYIGFADQAYSNGQTATIKTYGNTVNTLSGLTTGTLYYLQKDGTLGTSSNFTSFATNTPLAGTALSATKLLIRDPLAKT